MIPGAWFIDHFKNVHHLIVLKGGLDGRGVQVLKIIVLQGRNNKPGIGQSLLFVQQGTCSEVSTSGSKCLMFLTEVAPRVTSGVMLDLWFVLSCWNETEKKNNNKLESVFLVAHPPLCVQHCRQRCLCLVQEHIFRSWLGHSHTFQECEHKKSSDLLSSHSCVILVLQYHAPHVSEVVVQCILCFAKHCPCEQRQSMVKRRGSGGR